MYVIEVVVVMEKKTMRNWIAKDASMFSSILADTVNKFMLALERNALKTHSKVWDNFW